MRRIMMARCSLPTKAPRRVYASLLAGGLCHGAASIGHCADPASASPQTEVVAVVEVSFVPYGNLVLLREVLRGDGGSLKSPEELLGECLPSKAAVRDLAARGGADADVYQAAIDRAGYAAVLFLRGDGSALKPVCEARHPDARHWEQHPGHAQWRRQRDLPPVQ